MSKKQKIWLGISLALLIIPEILWSPILNFVYTFAQNFNSPVLIRPNFLTKSDNRGLVTVVVIFQVIGTLISIYLFNNVKNNYIKYIGQCALILALISSLFVLYILFASM